MKIQSFLGAIMEQCAAMYEGSNSQTEEVTTVTTTEYYDDDDDYEEEACPIIPNEITLNINLNINFNSTAKIDCISFSR